MTQRIEDGTNKAESLVVKEPRTLNEKVAFLTHALSPHRLALMEMVADEVSIFHVFLSQAEDKLHSFPLERGSLDVTVQRSMNWRHYFENVHGYADVSHINVPYDTVTQLLTFRPSVVISTELGARSLLAAVYKICCPGISLIIWATLSERTEATRGLIRKFVRRWLLHSADVVFVNGVGGSRYIRSLGYVGALHIIPYAIDATLFRTKSLNPQPGIFRLLYTGQLIQRKGVYGFCKTLDEWCRSHRNISVTLTLVGEGVEASRLATLVPALNFSIFIHPRASQRELSQFYDCADIAVLPTLGDEWGVVINEALVAGRPVLGSVHSQAVSELIREGENGWTWDPEEQGSLYKALSRTFCLKPVDLQKMSDVCKTSAAAISPEVVSARVLKALKGLALQKEATRSQK